MAVLEKYKTLAIQLTIDKAAAPTSQKKILENIFLDSPTILHQWFLWWWLMHHQWLMTDVDAADAETSFFSAWGRSWLTSSASLHHVLQHRRYLGKAQIMCLFEDCPNCDSIPTSSVFHTYFSISCLLMDFIHQRSVFWINCQFWCSTQ